MRLLDRYVAWAYVKNYLLSFLVLVGMYVVLDMVFNFDELVEVNQRPDMQGFKAVVNFARYVADFYAYQVALYFVHLSAIIPVVAAAFTLMRMTRFNELTALLASGVPLLRIGMPIIIVGLLFNGLLWVDQELVIPNIIHKLVRAHDYGAATSTHSYKVEPMRDEVTGGLLTASLYTPVPKDGSPPRLDMVDVLFRDENGDPAKRIKADLAVWDEPNQRWNLTNGFEDTNLSPRQREPVRSRELAYYKGNVTPLEIQLHRSGDFVTMLSTERINQLLERPRSYGQEDLLRVKHTRGVPQITLNMIILLLALGAVLTRDPQQLRHAAMRCIILCGLCMVLSFVGQELGAPRNLPPHVIARWPAIMAWAPILVFGPLSLMLLDRVKT
jgi:lipopolysaccharide export system permease protein